MAKRLGYIIDKGLSPIDNNPYVVILTLKSSNRKTGNMAQVWILREDINPVEAMQTGMDVTICGSCGHRKQPDGSRSCYVNVGQGPNSVWKAYKRGAYIDATASKDNWNKARLSVFNRRIRWGSYGDPSVIDPFVVEYFNEHANGHTGYTHQWEESFAQPFKGIFQASCDGFNQYLKATSNGWKTFTVIAKNQHVDYAKRCPATVTDSLAQCVTCKLCDGAKSDIYVNAHGIGSRYVTAA